MFTLIDTETTGLFDYHKRAHEEGQPRLCSIAMMTVSEQGEPMPLRLHCKVRPDGWSDGDRERLKAIEHIHGLTHEQLVAEGLPLRTVLERYLGITGPCRGIAAYGVEFDTKVMRGELRRAGYDDGYGGKLVFCINRAAHKLTKGKTPNLTEAYKALCGQTLGDAHDVLADLLATAEIFKVMLARDVVEWKEQRK